MEVCKICDRECKNVYAHYSAAHKLTKKEYENTTREEYETANAVKSVVDENEFEEVEEMAVIAPDRLRKERLSIKEIDLDETIGNFINRKGISPTEFNSLIKRYNDGDPIAITKAIERSIKAGEVGAESLKNESIVETTSTSVAETLIKKYGFVHVDTRRGPPKTHVVKKK